VPIVSGFVGFNGTRGRNAARADADRFAWWLDQVNRALDLGTTPRVYRSRKALDAAMARLRK